MEAINYPLLAANRMVIYQSYNDGMLMKIRFEKKCIEENKWQYFKTKVALLKGYSS